MLFLCNVATIYGMPEVCCFLREATRNLLWERRIRELFVCTVTEKLVTYHMHSGPNDFTACISYYRVICFLLPSGRILKQEIFKDSRLSVSR
jgi:hypothetical protein